MNPSDVVFEHLDQYDTLYGEHLYKVIKKYSSSIGLFLITFSELEHELNLAIADYLHHGSHDFGYIIVERLTIYNKIDLFYKTYRTLEVHLHNNKKRQTLNKIKKQLDSLNTFRNYIAHANWQSLTKDGFVRTKIIVDSQEGSIKFRKIKITPSIIGKKINETEKLLTIIDNYKEKIFQE